MKYHYRNPWARPEQDQFYHTDTEPFEHAGCQIFHVLKDQWDVVSAGKCIAQRAGKLGAMLCAESVTAFLLPTHEDVRTSMLAKHGHL